MDEITFKITTLVVIAIATIIFVYGPWHTREKCPSCKRGVPKDSSTCPKCGSALL